MIICDQEDVRKRGQERKIRVSFPSLGLPVESDELEM